MIHVRGGRCVGLLGLTVAACFAAQGAAFAGAKGRVGVYSAPSPQGQVVVGTLPGAGGQRGTGRYQRGMRQPQATGQGLGPRNYYFDRGTGQSGAGQPNMPSVYFNARTNRNNNPAHRVATISGQRQPDRVGLTPTEIRRLTDSLPPRRTNNVIDPRSPAAPRESSGISFGPSGQALVSALATKVAPASQRNLQGYRQGAPRHDSRKLPVFEMANHHGNQYLFAQGVWYVPHGGRLHPVLPPVGLTMPQLPSGYAEVNRDGQQYFSADGVYLRPYAGGYVVVEAPTTSQTAPN